VANGLPIASNDLGRDLKLTNALFSIDS
jgi:hypothetical protein